MDEELDYIIRHVFLPPQLPQRDDETASMRRALCDSVVEAAHAFSALGVNLPPLPTQPDSSEIWNPLIKMLEALSSMQDRLDPKEMSRLFKDMAPGEVLALHIQAQNAGVIIRRDLEHTTVSSFELSPPNAVVMGTSGKLICSYPGTTIEIENNTLQEDPSLIQEISSFLYQMGMDNLDSIPTTKKAGSDVEEQREPPSPHYITEFLTGVLRGLGCVCETPRVTKRIADDIVWKNSFLPWRRSPLWLLIRVSIQLSLPSAHKHAEYKSFMAYFMSHLIHRACDADVSTDLLSAMHAKLSRRIGKIDGYVPFSIRTFVTNNIKAARSLMDQRWLQVQSHRASLDSWDPETLDPAQDITLSLNNSRTYMKDVLHRHCHPPPHLLNDFKPTESNRLRDVLNFEQVLVQLDNPNSTILADFEVAVGQFIDSWVESQLEDLGSLNLIAQCMIKYHDAASNIYGPDPAECSIMLLIIFELWVAIDKMSIAQCPLLAEFEPEIPETLLYPLLLSKIPQIRRTARIVSYLRLRRSESQHGSVFSNSTGNHSFSIQFFRQSPMLQRLKKDIEDHASEQRRLKKEELQRLNREHKKLVKTAAELSHKYTPSGRHWKLCSRCEHEARAYRMSIAVHEWPLPSHEAHAQQVVFELARPESFGIWRSTTSWLLTDVCMSDLSRHDSIHTTLEGYSDLNIYLRRDEWFHITIASMTKSFKLAHYATKRIPSSESEVFVNNGLTFQLYDSKRCIWASNPSEFSESSHLCTFPLPFGPYLRLQHALAGTQHTQNFILANQSDCPQELDLHEYIAYGSLRAGGCVQWLNIARELATQSLTTSRVEVNYLLMQATWQLGPFTHNGAVLVPEWHHELNGATFGHTLLDVIKERVNAIASSWRESVSMRTLVAIICRLLESAKDNDVIERICDLLSHARAVTFKWVGELRLRLEILEDPQDVQECETLLCKVAAMCRSTFNVDSRHFPLLFASPKHVHFFLECGILVYDNTPPNLSTSDLDMVFCLNHDRRLAHRVEPWLSLIVDADSTGLDSSTMSLWKGFHRSSPWTQLPRPNDRWFMTHSESGLVHLNTLNGCLLVNGKPISRLPRDIMQDALYARIFGKKILRVFPINEGGMDFMTAGEVEGHEVLFGTPGPGALVIQARRAVDHHLFELLPHNLFVNDLPHALVDGQAHWIGLSEAAFGHVEIRPLESKWTTNPNHWSFTLSTECTMTDGTACLIDIRSKTCHMIAQVLQGIESPKNLVITHTSIFTSTPGVVVSLPRYQLSFNLRNGVMHCHELHNMIIDTNQSIGTLVGLVSRLILRPATLKMQGLPIFRRILIPHGIAVPQRTSHHVDVTIDTGSAALVKYSLYEVDTTLQRLNGDGSLFDHLWTVYLHAVTSHPLPDPFTERPGVDVAFDGLQSAQVFSFQQLLPEDVTLLRQIYNLTPRRKWYPLHLKGMQKVHWNPQLPLNAQRPEFSMLVLSVHQHNNRLSPFYPDHQSSPSPPIIDPFLNNRAAARGLATFFPRSPASLCIESTDQPRVLRARRPSESSVDSEVPVYRVSCLMTKGTSEQGLEVDILSYLQSRVTQLHPLREGPVLYNREWFNPDTVKNQFLTLYNACCHPENLGGLRFALCAMIYGNSSLESLILSLLCCVTDIRFNSLHLPSCDAAYLLSNGFEPTREAIESLLTRFETPFEQSSQARLPREDGELWEELQKRRKQEYSTALEDNRRHLLDSVLFQWPTTHPSYAPQGTLIDTVKAMKSISLLFQSCSQNATLRNHFAKVTNHLQTAPQHHRMEVSPLPALPHPDVELNVFKESLPTLPSLIQTRVPLPQLRWEPHQLDETPMSVNSNIHSTPHLDMLISKFTTSSDPLQRQYGNDLKGSQQAYVMRPVPQPQTPSLSALAAYVHHSETFKTKVYHAIRNMLLPSKDEYYLLHATRWPSVTPSALLELLAFGTRQQIRSGWKSLLILLARATLRWQRACRMYVFCQQENLIELTKEVMSPLPDNHEDVDWLLIQIQGNFNAHSVQRQIAGQMINPPEGFNTVMQLNMGEGKSSVIIPFVAATLANGHHLTRVVVLKPLVPQMFNTLVQRLSGLTNRRIYFLPFSRAISLKEHAASLRQIYEECLRLGGILLIQPEHILSFKLMAIDHHLDQHAPSDGLLEIQRWLDQVVRDVLDESDEILHVRYQLVYTMGLRREIEGTPNRWNIAQDVLARSEIHLALLRRDYKSDVDYVLHGEGTYPQIQRLTGDSAQTLIARIALDALLGLFPSYPQLGRFPSTHRYTALEFLTASTPSLSAVHAIRDYCAGDTSTWSSILLIRGLLAQSVLLHALVTRRHRVDYGLDSRRPTLLAVPYRAKDVPSLQAEFGHPDISILLTCLTYYQGGLSDHQVLLCFELLFKQDDQVDEYARWVSRGQEGLIPATLHSLSGINLEDGIQRTELSKFFRHNRSVIQFFLSSVVFPREAKEFPQKIATSAWDLAQRNHFPTTGFSGTKDNYPLLPTPISQLDDPSQLFTDALVLDYLLRPENDDYESMHSEDDFIESLSQREDITVLLDVGALLLNHTNKESAKKWLSMRKDPKTCAVVFFHGDVLSVLDRHGTMQPLRASSYKSRLGQCLVYLDDEHTRGTDLKLPLDARAMVTIGPKTTKDRLVQGCMRMRQLGQGQTVAFVAHTEVDRAIREAVSKSPQTELHTFDCLYWTLLQTCRDLEHNFSHWVQQGTDWTNRNAAWEDLSSDVLSEYWLQPDAKSLEQLYGPPSIATDAETTQPKHPNANFTPLEKRCDKLGIVKFDMRSARMEEEQEREMAVEQEQERQVQRPPKVAHAEHSVHADVRTFVAHGVIPPNSPAFLQLFDGLNHIVPIAEPSVWASFGGIWATRDFLTTIEGGLVENSGEYLRPANWVASSRHPHGTVLVLFSPFEVNELLPFFRSSKVVSLHCYAPRTTRRVQSFEDLRFYTIPSFPSELQPPAHAITLLNIFSGQLYVQNRQTTATLLDFFAVYNGKFIQPQFMQQEDVQSDGFVGREHRRDSMISSRFERTPLPAVAKILVLRRKGMTYASTHMGKMLNGFPLIAEDFDS